MLRMPNSTRAIRIALPFPLRDGIAHWDGKILPPGSEITPAELAQLVAFGEGKLTLCCELKRAEINIPLQYTLGERELGLRPLAERIRSDLAWAGIDAWVALSFVGATDKPWQIKPFDSEICCANGTVSIQRIHGIGEGALAAAGRPVSAPCEEQCLAEICLEDALNRRSIALSQGMLGAWWIYLRSGRMVRSRPSIVVFSVTAPPSGEGLAAMAAIASPSERQAAIASRVEALSAGVDGTAEDVAWLNRLIGSLDGLPASTFDALTALAYTPPLLARLLLSADEAAQTAIWRLEAELLFLWAALPLDAWHAAAHATGRNIAESLHAAGWEWAQAAATGKQVMDNATSRAGSLDPAIAAALAAAGLLPRPDTIPTILEAAQGYVRRTYDRGDAAFGMPKHTSLFRTDILAPHLPDWFATQFDSMHLEALDVPVAVAVAAKMGIRLTPIQIRRCKELAAIDPVYFAEGVAAALLGTKR